VHIPAMQDSAHHSLRAQNKATEINGRKYMKYRDKEVKEISLEQSK